MSRKLALIPLVAVIAAACGGAAAPTTTSTTAASAAPTQAAASASPSAAPYKLTVGYSETYMGELPVWYAAEKGFFAKNGLDVTLEYTASATAIASLLSGKIDLSQGGGSETVSADANGGDLVVIGSVVPVYPYVFLVPASIKTIGDLKGKKVGASNPGSESDIATRDGLTKEGLNPDSDVTMVYVGSSQNRTAALFAGSIQGGMDQPPGALELEAKGLHVLFNEVDQKIPTINNGIIVKKSFIKAHKDVVQRYVDSIVESIAALKKDHAGGVALLTSKLKITDPKIADATYTFATGLFPAIPQVDPAAFSDTIKVLEKKNPKVANLNVNSLYDNEFMKSAQDRGLDKQ
ncbi:MAG: ABC transporter substrate-binding protein [Chloroflexota bacterium]|nr:ABC transporter substrate-binding protein [Chloroflexota bacterium]MDE3101586.1 ABC transporter substrate-binding protein [Chloroflexota bacterium]